MRLGFARSSSNALVGLDIGSSLIKVVETKRSAGGFELIRVGTASVPNEAIVQGAFINTGAIVDAIHEAMSQAGIKKKNVAVSVSGHSVIVKTLRLPISVEDEFEQSVRWEAEQHIPFDLNEVNLDFQVLNPDVGDNQMEVLLVAAKKDLIDDTVQLLGEADLETAVVDVDAFTIQNAYMANYDCEDGDQQGCALVHLGAQKSTVNIVRNGIPAFTRDLVVGGNQYNEEIQKALSIGFDEAETLKLGKGVDREAQPSEVGEAIQRVTDSIVGEIARSLDFYTATGADARIRRILLSGGAAKTYGLLGCLSDRMAIPVEVLDPFAHAQISSKIDSQELEALGSSLAAAVGLALRESGV